MTTFVRVGPDEIAAMAKRLNSMMTAEGAKAWYARDVAELLQEVVALRQERQEAFDSFTEHLRDKPDAETPLPALSAMWKEHASGFWEKTQTRKLRDQILGYEETIKKLNNLEGQLEARLAELISAQEQASADWLSKELALQQSIRDHAEALAQEAQTKNDLLVRLAQLDERLAAERKANTEAVLAATLNADQEKEKARAALLQALEVLS